MALSLLPSIPPLWREGRLPLELAALVRDPVYRGEEVEHAMGHPVLLIPGFLAGDDSLRLMTHWLRRTGHHTRKAGFRSNVDCSEAATARLEERLEVMAETRGEKVSIIGQSRGGGLAKALAVRRPDLVAGVVALGSPIVDPLAIHPLVHAQVYAVGALGTLGVRGLFKRSCRAGKCCEDFWADLERPVPRGVGYLSIYSKSDGIVKWEACLDPSAAHLEVRTSHVGMAVHPAVYRAVAGALAAFRTREVGRSRLLLQLDALRAA